MQGRLSSFTTNAPWLGLFARSECSQQDSGDTLSHTDERAGGTPPARPTIATAKAAALAALAEGDVDLALRWLESALSALGEVDDLNNADVVTLITIRDHALRGIGLFHLAEALHATALQTWTNTKSGDAATPLDITRIGV
jgi:hypothetical protein